MALLSTPVEKAERRVTDIDARITEVEAQRSPELDFDRNFALAEEAEKLKRMRAEAEKALTYAQEQAANAAAEAEKAKDMAEIKAYQREAERDVPSCLRKIGKLQEQLVPELAFLDAHVKRAGDINALARKHGVPGVRDGEDLLRGTPMRVIPAQFEEREIVRAANGRQVHEFWEVRGVLHSHHGPCTKRRERVEVRGQTVEPGGIPGGRIALAVRLVDLKCQQIWPVSR